MFQFSFVNSLNAQKFKLLCINQLGENKGYGGTRIPAIWTYGKKVYFYFEHNGEVEKVVSETVQDNKSDDIVAQRFVINQQLVVDKETQKESYLTKILQDQKIIWNKTNDQPTSYKDVKVYGGDDWYESTEGIVELSHLKISDKAPPSGKN